MSSNNHKSDARLLREARPHLKYTQALDAVRKGVVSEARTALRARGLEPTRQALVRELTLVVFDPGGDRRVLLPGQTWDGLRTAAQPKDQDIAEVFELDPGKLDRLADQLNAVTGAPSADAVRVEPSEAEQAMQMLGLDPQIPEALKRLAGGPGEMSQEQLLEICAPRPNAARIDPEIVAKMPHRIPAGPRPFTIASDGPLSWREFRGAQEREPMRHPSLDEENLLIAGETCVGATWWIQHEVLPHARGRVVVIARDGQEYADVAGIDQVIEARTVEQLRKACESLRWSGDGEVVMIAVIDDALDLLGKVMGEPEWVQMLGAMFQDPAVKTVARLRDPRALEAHGLRSAFGRAMMIDSARASEGRDAETIGHTFGPERREAGMAELAGARAALAESNPDRWERIALLNDGDDVPRAIVLDQAGVRSKILASGRGRTAALAGDASPLPMDPGQLEALLDRARGPIPPAISQAPMVLELGSPGIGRTVRRGDFADHGREDVRWYSLRRGKQDLLDPFTTGEDLLVTGRPAVGATRWISGQLRLAQHPVVVITGKAGEYAKNVLEIQVLSLHDLTKAMRQVSTIAANGQKMSVVIDDVLKMLVADGVGPGVRHPHAAAAALTELLDAKNVQVIARLHFPALLAERGLLERFTRRAHLLGRGEKIEQAQIGQSLGDGVAAKAAQQLRMAAGVVQQAGAPSITLGVLSDVDGAPRAIVIPRGERAAQAMDEHCRDTTRGIRPAPAKTDGVARTLTLGGVAVSPFQNVLVCGPEGQGRFEAACALASDAIRGNWEVQVIAVDEARRRMWDGVDGVRAQVAASDVAAALEAGTAQRPRLVVLDQAELDLASDAVAAVLADAHTCVLLTCPRPPAPNAREPFGVRVLMGAAGPTACAQMFGPEEAEQLSRWLRRRLEAGERAVGLVMDPARSGLEEVGPLLPTRG